MNQPAEWNRRAVRTLNETRMLLARLTIKVGQTTDLDSAVGREIESLARDADEKIQNAIRQTEIAIDEIGREVTKQG